MIKTKNKTTIRKKYCLPVSSGKISYMRQVAEMSMQHKDDTRRGKLNNCIIQISHRIRLAPSIL